ncbi:hypothetical protein [Paenibacillus elgii]|uniref:hypothetical protein n=1 Tax=Paenibacillus elgii TaxID=189691 RepID=UPI000248DAD2|nr:hypothetical protein [Paenibacillus elgii]
MMRGLAELYASGLERDSQAVYHQGRWMTLPAYQWQKNDFGTSGNLYGTSARGTKDYLLPGACKNVGKRKHAATVG